MELLGAAAGALAGGGIDSIFSKASADQSYEYNRRLQKHDQEWQEKMRATQYQTTVEDMQKAGINPAVALSGGASLSSQGGGSSASAQAPTANATQAGANLAEVMQATALTKAQKENIEADTEMKDAQSGKTREEQKTEKYKREFEQKTEQIRIAMMSGELTKQQYDMMVNQATTELLQEQIGIARAERKTAENNRRWHEIRDSIVAFIPFASGMTKKSGGITINNN